MPEISEREMDELRHFMKDSRTFQAETVLELRSIKDHLRILNGSVARNTTSLGDAQIAVARLEQDSKWISERRKEDRLELDKRDDRIDHRAKETGNRLYEWVKANAVTGLLLLGLIVNIVLSLAQ